MKERNLSNTFLLTLHKFHCAKLSKDHNIWCNIKKIKQKDIKERVGKSNWLTQYWTETKKSWRLQNNFLQNYHLRCSNSNFSFLLLFFFCFKLLVHFLSLIQFFSLFFFVSLVSNFWCKVHTGWYNFFFFVSSSSIFFLGLLNNFKDGALRNLTFCTKFLPLSFLLEKMSPKTYLHRIGKIQQFFCFL